MIARNSKQRNGIRLVLPMLTNSVQCKEVVVKADSDRYKSGCPQSKKNEVKGILLLDFEFFIGVKKR
jgi:hypothetical protein